VTKERSLIGESVDGGRRKERLGVSTTPCDAVGECQRTWDREREGIKEKVDIEEDGNAVSYSDVKGAGHPRPRLWYSRKIARLNWKMISQLTTLQNERRKPILVLESRESSEPLKYGLLKDESKRKVKYDSVREISMHQH